MDESDENAVGINGCQTPQLLAADGGYVLWFPSNPETREWAQNAPRIFFALSVLVIAISVAREGSFLGVSKVLAEASIGSSSRAMPGQ